MANSKSCTNISKEALTKDMQGHPSTNNWDVICCYNEPILNSLLEKKYKEERLIVDVKFSYKYEDPFSGTIDVDIDILLGEPLLQFVYESRNICKLTMPVRGGSYTLTPEDDPEKAKHYEIIPDVIQVICNVPIASASGDLSESDIHDGRTPIIFDDGSTHQTLFLHFRNDDLTTFDIEPIPGKEEKAEKILVCQPNMKADTINNLALKFKENVSEIDYALGGLNNHPQPGTFFITPVSFIFQICKPYEDCDGSLNLYIQTEETGNQPGDRNPSFQPAGTAIPSIPDSYTASLIISADAFSKYLQKLLADKSCKPEQEADGVKVAIYVDKTVAYPGYHRDANHWFNGISIDISSTPMFLHYDMDHMTATLASPEKGGGYYNYDYCRGEFLGGDGTLYAKFSISQNNDLRVSEDGKINLDFNVQESSVSVTTRIHVAHHGWTIDEKPIEDGLKASIPKDVGTISINMDFLSVFVVSNLMFPDKSIFKFSSDEGYYVPKDLIIFGHISDQ